MSGLDERQAERPLPNPKTVAGAIHTAESTTPVNVMAVPSGWFRTKSGGRLRAQLAPFEYSRDTWCVAVRVEHRLAMSGTIVLTSLIASELNEGGRLCHGLSPFPGTPLVLRR